MSKKLRIGVFGAGAVGQYVGARLAVHTDLVFVGREHQRQGLESRGITATSLSGDSIEAPPGSFEFASDAAALANCDVVLVAVKSAQTDFVARALEPLADDSMLIVSLQNGVSNAGTLRNHVPSVAASVVGFNVVMEEGGVVRQTTSGPLAIEETASPLHAALLDAMAAAHIEVESFKDITGEKWTKLVINLSNAISALSGVPTKEIVLTRRYRLCMAMTIEEAVRVLRASGIKPARLRGIPLGILPSILRMPTAVVRLVSRARLRVDPRARASMYSDLERRRPTEVDYLNGEIVRLASESQTRAPINKRLVELVHDAEAKEAGSPNLSADDLYQALSQAD